MYITKYLYTQRVVDGISRTLGKIWPPYHQGIGITTRVFYFTCSTKEIMVESTENRQNAHQA